MDKKWNLQDIQPASRPRRAPKRMAAQGKRESEGEEIKINRASSRAEQPQAEEQVAPAKRKRVVRKTRTEEPAEEHFDTISIVDGNSAKRTKLIVAIVLFLIIVLGGIFSSALMGGAEVVVKPRNTEKNVVANFTGSPTPIENGVTYELLTLEAEGERQVKATGQEEVTKQSEGTILIYNEFSTSPVRLVKNTRFQTASGLIFKIKESAVVPGYSTDENGEMIRGVITADVFAEAAGDDYNVGPSQFTIPGFVGYPEYEKVFAESTSAMTGGFSGQKFIIDETELETARQALHTELRDALLERLKNQRPADFVLYDNAVTFIFNSLPAIAYGDDLATIKEQGVLRVPIFKEDVLAKFLAEQSVPGYEGLAVRLDDYQALSFNYISPTTTVSDISLTPKLNFNLSGDVQIIWQFNENELKADLLGVEKTAISQILGKYPAIDTATAEIRPFWKSSFPREMKEISVIEVIE